MMIGSPILCEQWIIKVGLYSLILLVFWLVMATAGQAATYTVNSTADSPLSSGMCDGVGTCTLRAAIQAANTSANTKDSQGVIQPDIINIPAGTYTLTIAGINEDQAATGDLDITESVTITGDTSATTLIDGNNIDRVFHIIQTGTTSVIVAISDVTIENGHIDGGIGGGLYNNGGTVAITDSAVSNNSITNVASPSSGASGGGIFNSGTLTLTNVAVSNNIVDINGISTSGSGGGGGIYNTGSLRVENCTLDGNQVLNGASDGSGGGGIQNTGVAGAGPNAVKTTIIRSTISNNTAPLGGGVRNLFGRINIDLAVIDGNSVELSGGGVQNADGGMAITRSVIRNNIAQQTGGGVDNLAALDITQSSIYDNQTTGIIVNNVVTTAGGAGGGIFNGAAGALNLVNTTVSGNQALAGGGINNHKELTATNSTIFDNSAASTCSAPQQCGGTEVFACGSQDNSGNGCDTGIRDASGKIIIHTNFVNTIVGNSTTSDNCNGDTADLIVSNGHNIETANTCGFAESGDQIGVSSVNLFGANTFKYYGGDLASLLSIAIPSTSPARDAGDNTSCTASDERGFLRDSQCDIGAYEYNAENNPGNANSSVLDLALDISDKVAAPLNGTVQVTVTLSVVNKGPLQATNVILTGSIPPLSWLHITSLGSGTSSGACSQTTTGFTCTIPSIAAYDSADFFVAVLATQAGGFTVSGEVKSDQVDNYRPDNLKSATIDIPTVAGSSVSGNNFAGASGGGTLDWLSLAALLPSLARKRRRKILPLS